MGSPWWAFPRAPWLRALLRGTAWPDHGTDLPFSAAYGLGRARALARRVRLELDRPSRSAIRRIRTRVCGADRHEARRGAFEWNGCAPPGAAPRRGQAGRRSRHVDP